MTTQIANDRRPRTDRCGSARPLVRALSSLFLRLTICLSSVICLSAAACLASVVGAGEGGRYAEAKPELRQWFRSQVSPATGISCCSEADGEFAEEDIRYDDNGVGHYWTRWSAHPAWMEVPDSVVIRTPNTWGRPVVWWGKDNISNIYFIRCYAVGSGA